VRRGASPIDSSGFLELLCFAKYRFKNTKAKIFWREIFLEGKSELKDEGDTLEECLPHPTHARTRYPVVKDQRLPEIIVKGKFILPFTCFFIILPL